MSDINNFSNMVEGEGEATEIVEYEESASSIKLADFTSNPNFDASEISIPRIRLAQGLTAEVTNGSATPGQWIVSGYPAANDLVVIPISFARHNTLRDTEGGAMQCYAVDATTGVGTPGGICASCSFHQWRPNEKGGANLPPLCTSSYVYVVYDVVHETIALIEFRRTNITAGRALNTMVIQRGLGNFAVQLKSMTQKSKKGQAFHQMVITPISGVEPAAFERAKKFIGK